MGGGDTPKAFRGNHGTTESYGGRASGNSVVHNPQLHIRMGQLWAAEDQSADLEGTWSAVEG